MPGIAPLKIVYLKPACRTVRHLLSNTLAPSKSSPASLCGGLQDLSQAFDGVPRGLVEDSIRAAGFTPETEATLMIWLHGGVFQIQHKGLQTTVPCTKGVKQGSKGGPYQWNLVTRYSLWKLAQAKGIHWVQTHITNFADDYHLAWAGSSEIFFHRATREMAEFFELLESFGLRINLGIRLLSLELRGLASMPLPETSSRNDPRGCISSAYEAGPDLSCSCGEKVELPGLCPVIRCLRSRHCYSPCEGC